MWIPIYIIFLLLNNQFLRVMFCKTCKIHGHYISFPIFTYYFCISIFFKDENQKYLNYGIK